MVGAVGHRLQANKYIVEEVLGQGGFGITYKAIHVPSDQPVVIKTANEHLKNDPDYTRYLKRFVGEARLMLNLSQKPNSHLVRLRDLFDEGETPYLVMDFVAGQSLLELVQQQGALSEEEACGYIYPVGEALTVMHKAGLVHRDAYPGNFILPGNGKAILVDFSIAGGIVPSDYFVGTGFAPYEQMEGSCEPTVDVYYLAATLYYAVTGQRPTTSFDRKLYQVELAPPKQLNPSISDKLNQAILKGMALEAKDRPPSMQEWLGLLEKPKAVSPSLEPGESREDIIPSSQETLDFFYQPKTPQKIKLPWVRLLTAFIGYALIGILLPSSVMVAGVVALVVAGVGAAGA
ncbi:MAG: serine/threonine-protein kinase, partial [Coleofasciculaceae cyanobacterium]